jgi:hypothetical protein
MKDIRFFIFEFNDDNLNKKLCGNIACTLPKSSYIKFRNNIEKLKKYENELTIDIGSFGFTTYKTGKDFVNCITIKDIAFDEFIEFHENKENTKNSLNLYRFIDTILYIFK